MHTDAYVHVCVSDIHIIKYDSRDRQGIYGMQHFTRLETHLTIGFS